MHPKLEQFIKEDLLDELHQLEDFVDDEVNRRLDEMDDTIKKIEL